MNKEKLVEELKHDEGLMFHAYKDSLGYLTIGIGRLIDKRKGGGITESEANYLLENDIDKITRSLQHKFIYYQRLDGTRQRALCNMCFQLGLDGLLGFKKMLTAIDKEDWDEAYIQALDSKWARQTPVRAKRIAGMILRGD